MPPAVAKVTDQVCPLVAEKKKVNILYRFLTFSIVCDDAPLRFVDELERFEQLVVHAKRQLKLEVGAFFDPQPFAFQLRVARLSKQKKRRRATKASTAIAEVCL